MFEVSTNKRVGDAKSTYNVVISDGKSSILGLYYKDECRVFPTR